VLLSSKEKADGTVGFFQGWGVPLT
jgi:hypothetical protein